MTARDSVLLTEMENYKPESAVIHTKGGMQEGYGLCTDDQRW